MARETRLQEMYDNNNSVTNSIEEQIQKQSIDMIKQVECTEEAFRVNFNSSYVFGQKDFDQTLVYLLPELCLSFLMIHLVFDFFLDWAPFYFKILT